MRPTTEQLAAMVVLETATLARHKLEAEREETLAFIDGQIEKVRCAGEQAHEATCYQMRANIVGSYVQVLEDVEQRIAEALKILGMNA